MNAKELLTSLQLGGRTYRSNKKFLNETKNGSYFGLPSEIHAGIVKRIEYENKIMPTDYQNSFFYNMIKDSFDSLQWTINDKKDKFEKYIVNYEKIPLFGTTDFEGYNAFVEVGDNEKVIVFNNELLLFTNKVMEIYTMEHWLASNELINRHIEKIFAQNFVDILLSYHVFSNLYASIPLSLCELTDLEDLGNTNKIYELSSSIDELIDLEKYVFFEKQITIPVFEWFAAHEYAHVLLGHLDDKNDTCKLNLCGSNVEAVNFAYQEEFDADLLGAIITLECDDSCFSANGIFLAMTCIFLSELYKDSEKKNTHPPAQERIKKVFSYINNNKKLFFVSNYREVDIFFAKKYSIYKRVLDDIRLKKLQFFSPIEMQKYIYKKCEIFDNLF